MDSLITLGVLSIIIQFVIERLKIFLPETGREISVPAIALVIGVAISWATQTALMAAINITLTPIWIDYILTGIAFSGGSVAFNELLKLISEKRPSNIEQ